MTAFKILGLLEENIVKEREFYSEGLIRMILERKLGTVEENKWLPSIFLKPKYKDEPLECCDLCFLGLSTK